MRTKHLIPGMALALAFVPSAAAQKPQKPPKPSNPPAYSVAAVTLAANPSVVVYGGPTTLSGRLTATSARNVLVRLERDATRPYGDGYTSAGTTRTASNGRYSFASKPLVNTQYRVVAQSSPPATSRPQLVLVRTLVGIKLSDSTPRRGSLTRFSGSVYPAHDGRSAAIQKRSPSGRFVTVAGTKLRDAGAARSSYVRRVRIYRSGVYRVKVAGDADHINGFSRLRTITVHG